MCWVVLSDATPVEVLVRQVSPITSVKSFTSSPTSASAASTSSGSVSNTNGWRAVLDLTPSSTEGSLEDKKTRTTLFWVALLSLLCVAFMFYMFTGRRLAQWWRRRLPSLHLLSRRVPEQQHSSRPFYPSFRHPSPYPTPPPNALLSNHAAIHSDALLALLALPALPAHTQINVEGRREHRGVRGANTDAGGRRTGTVDAEEHGEGIGKEELPAYEGSAKSGPPRYFDVIMHRGAFGSGSGHGAMANTGRGEMELTDMNRHPADRSLGDPFVNAGQSMMEWAGTSTGTGVVRGTRLDLGENPPNLTSQTQGDRGETEIANNMSGEHIVMPAEPHVKIP